MLRTSKDFNPMLLDADDSDNGKGGRITTTEEEDLTERADSIDFTNVRLSNQIFAIKESHFKHQDKIS